MTPPAAAGAAQPLAPGRRRAPASPRPRRVSGPARPARKAPPRESSGTAADRRESLVGRALAWFDALSSHRLLDKLIRGRLWIGIIAFALIGIVTLQLGLLKMNSSIGRALEKQSALERENAALSIEDSELASGIRVESQAEALGMRLVAVGGLKFHSSHAAADVPRAEQALSSPQKQPERTAETSTTSSTAAAASESQPSSGGAAAATGSEEAAQRTSASAGETPSGGEAAPPPETPAAGGAATAETSASSPTTESGGGGTAAPGG